MARSTRQVVEVRLTGGDLDGPEEAAIALGDIGPQEIAVGVGEETQEFQQAVMVADAIEIQG